MNETYFNSKKLRENFILKKIKINKYEKLEKLGRFTFKKFLGIFSVFFETFFKLIFFKPNLIYFEIAPTGIAFLRDSIYALLCKFFRKKIIFQFHARGIEKKSSSNLWRKYYKFIFKNSKAIILSELLYHEIKRVIPKENVYILPNGIKDLLTDKEFKIVLSNRKKNKKPTLLFLSNMIEEKGPLDVLKICNELKKNKVKFECLFVGALQEKDIKEKWDKMRKEFKLEKDCKYLGAKYGEEKKRNP